MTPADVTIALDAHERRERAAYWRTGLVTATLINVNRAKGAALAGPEDFVPTPRRQRATPQSPAQMANVFHALTVAMGGEVVAGGH